MSIYFDVESGAVVVPTESAKELISPAELKYVLELSLNRRLKK